MIKKYILLIGLGLLAVVALLTLNLLKPQPDPATDATIFSPTPKIAIRDVLRAEAEGDLKKISGMGTVDLRKDLALMHSAPGTPGARKIWSKFSRNCLATGSKCLSKPTPYFVHGHHCMLVKQPLDSVETNFWYLQKDRRGWSFVGMDGITR